MAQKRRRKKQEINYVVKRCPTEISNVNYRCESEHKRSTSPTLIFELKHFICSLTPDETNEVIAVVPRIIRHTVPPRTVLEEPPCARHRC